MNDDSHFLMSLGADFGINGKTYHAERCRQIADKIEQLRATLKDASDALYNAFEPDNQSLTYKRVMAVLNNEQKLDGEK